MEDNKLIIAYWDFQGLAHPTRLLLSYFKVLFEDKIYQERDDWFKKDKLTIKSPCPNLPYVQDGDRILTESLACIQYAAMKTGQKDLLGKNDLDSVRIAQLWGVSRDLIVALGRLAWNPEFEKEKETVRKEKAEPILSNLAKAVGEQDYPIGYLTWADFVCVHAIDVASRLWPDLVSAHPNLIKYRDRILSNEGIQAYRKSEKYTNLFLPTRASWSGEEKI